MTLPHVPLAPAPALVPALVLALLMVLPPRASAAQAARAVPLQFEARADIIAAQRPTGHLGLGANVGVGNYLRVGVVAGGGATRTADDDVVGSARADLVGRFLLDPFREHAWGPYAGAGVGVLWTDGARTREVLLVVLGVEGGAQRRVRPALEVGFGGGTRAGLVLRWGRPEAR